MFFILSLSAVQRLVNENWKNVYDQQENFSEKLFLYLKLPIYKCSIALKKPLHETV